MTSGSGGTRVVATAVGGTSADDTSSNSAHTGGNTGSGGSGLEATMPTGGNDASGGETERGGTDSSGGSSETSASGGTDASGGADATGGETASGGTDSTGSTSTNGGDIASGGTEATGGTGTNCGDSASGGTEATGGARTNGGDTANGGTDANGGDSAQGGENSGGETGIGYEPPVLSAQASLTPNDNEAAPLAATLNVATNLSTTGTVLVSGGGETWSLSLEDAPVHEVPLLGFKPDTEYIIAVTVTTGDTHIDAEPLVWHTPPLPDDFPHLAFIQSEPGRMAPGMTLFDVIVARYAIVVDSLGEVRWFYRAPRTNDRYRLLADGNIICVSDYGSYLTEIDWFGNTVNTWFAANSSTAPAGTIPVAVRNFHHNIDEMPNGNLLVLAQEARYVNNYPTSSFNPNAPTSRARVTGDQIVELTRAGEVVKRYSLFDVIDPTRIGHDSEINNDWTHSNAVIYDPASDAYLVSMRHQDAVIKIRRETGELVWILGNPANWRTPWKSKLLAPLGADFEWQYHQHAVQLTPGGIGLYDNGNYRVPAYEDPLPAPYHSRVVRFAIDEVAMTVEQQWTYFPKSGNDLLYSYAMSDADLQANGNVLIASGTLTSLRANPGWAQIIEVTDAGDPVFELNVVDAPQDATTFDADRIPDIRYMSSPPDNG